jgi:hypothetical protein
MGARVDYGKSKRNGEAGLEGKRRAAKGEEKNDMEEGVRSRHLLDGRETARRNVWFRSGCFASSRGFSKIIGERCDVGGWYWSY